MPGEFINVPPVQVPVAVPELRTLGYSPSDAERQAFEMLTATELVCDPTWHKFFAFMAAQLQTALAATGGGATIYAPAAVTADSTINTTAPAFDGQMLVVELSKDGVGNWVITWGANFDASVTEQGDDLRLSVFVFYGKGGKWYLAAQPVYR